MQSVTSFGCNADHLSQLLESADCAAHTTTARKGRWLLLPLQMLTSAAVLVARQIETRNR